MRLESKDALGELVLHVIVRVIVAVSMAMRLVVATTSMSAATGFGLSACLAPNEQGEGEENYTDGNDGLGF